MFREEQRNHEFFTAIALPNPRSGDPGSHSTRSGSPRQSLMPFGNLDEVESGDLRGWPGSLL